MFRSIALLVATAPSALAATFVVEDPALKDVPPAVAEAVVRFEKANRPVNYRGEPCRFVGKEIALSDSPGTDWALTTADACSWAASAAPVWLVRRDQGAFRVVLSHVTYDLTVGTATQNGLRNVATARATAARREEQLWKYDGVQYRVVTNRVR